MNSIDKWRLKIDELDAELVKLLNERAKFAEEIGKLKSKLGLDALETKLADLDLAAKKGETELTDGLYQFVLAL